MTEYFLFKIWLKDEKGIPAKEPEVFKNVMHYGAVDNAFWFMRSMGQLVDKSAERAFGSYDVKFLWFPLDRIYKMEALSQSVFSDHTDKERYVKEVIMGVPYKKPSKFSKK